MDTRTIRDVARELEAHEKECSLYRDMAKQSLDKLEARIIRLEKLIMGSTISVVSILIAMMFKVM